MRELEFDGIIIGTGPNGLTTADIFKAGLKVAVLEGDMRSVGIGH